MYVRRCISGISIKQKINNNTICNSIQITITIIEVAKRKSALRAKEKSLIVASYHATRIRKHIRLCMHVSTRTHRRKNLCLPTTLLAYSSRWAAI